MKKKIKLGVLLAVILLVSSHTKITYANSNLDGMNLETTQNVIAKIKASTEKVKDLAAEDTIANIFPDANLAQVIANEVAGGDVNALLTQSMIEGVKGLNASNSNIQDITGIEVLTNLGNLNLSDNQITSVPESIGNLTGLKYLSFRDNQIESLPESIGNLHDLSDLALDNNKLVSLPERIGDLESLYQLVLDNNLLTSFPESIGNLKKLTVIAADNNLLTSLPNSIGGLESLGNLWLVNNKITSLPDGVGNLYSLINFDLTLNKLTNVPESIGNLSGLETLWLGGNQLTSLPESMSGLSSMYYLVINSNYFTEFPESVVGLDNLLYLEAADNQLTSLPESIGDFSGLEGLWLSSNQLTSLPESIGNLSGLEGLWLWGNLLPTDYDVTLKTLGLSSSIYYEEQRQLSLLTGLEPFKVVNENDLNNINLFDVVVLDDGEDVLSTHELILENYVDENNNPVNINDYIQNGNVIKVGTVFVQVRATGTGVFPNNSDHAVTMDRIQLDFELPPITYSLSFNLNGGEGVAPKAQVLAEGETGVAVDDPIRRGYTFTGWNTLADGSGTTWNFASTTMPANDVTLYAQWSINQHELSFNLNGGEGTAPDSQDLDFDTLATQPQPPIRTGYTFNGWNTQQDGTGIIWDFTVDRMPDNNIVLYAQWSINQHELSFNLNGGEGTAPASQDLDFDTLATQPQPPIRTGYTFNGWNTQQDGTGITWDFAVDRMPDNNIVLYAQWEKNFDPIVEYTLRFDLNGGQGVAPTNQMLNEGQKASKPTSPSREEYVFKGWNTAKDGSGITWDFEINTMPANDVTLYAQWSKQNLPVTGDSSNAISLSSLLVVVGATVIVINKRRILK